MKAAKEIANYIIEYTIKIRQPINNLQLQKILYYIQVYFLRKTGSPIFKDKIEAWQNGPIIPTVYFQNAVFGIAPITIFQPSSTNWNIEEKRKVERIIESKINISLENMTKDINKKGKAWNIYYKRNKKVPISKEALKLYG